MGTIAATNMPKIRRTGIPPPLFIHLADRRVKWGISYDELMDFGAWLDRNPEAPPGKWFKSFLTSLFAAKGSLSKLSSQKAACPREQRSFKCAAPPRKPRLKPQRAGLVL